MNPLAILFISILAAATAQLSIKKGVSFLGPLEFSLNNLGGLIFQVLKNFYIVFGLFLLGVSFMLWIFVISKKQLNIVYPVSASFTIILVTVFSWFLFKEQLSFYHIAGIFLIILGIFLLLKP
jgi:multidrug transporter EmrE-like cation transporter